MRHARVFSAPGTPPVPVFSVPRLPGRLVGLSCGPFALVQRDYADDWPTIVHELEHCRQFWRRGLIVHFARYYLDRGYRLRAELEAFGAEIAACAPARRAERLDDSARALSTGYRLRLDTAACRRLLVADARDREARRAGHAGRGRAALHESKPPG